MRFTFTFHRQKGDALLEALVSMALVAIIGMGIAYSSSRAMVAQAKFNAQYSAITQLNRLFQTGGTSLCGTTPTITVGSTSLNVTVTCSPISSTAITVNGVAVDMTSAQGNATQMMTLSVTSASLFGGSGTLSVGN